MHQMALENLLRVAVLSDNQVMQGYNNFLDRVRIAGLDFTSIHFPEPSSKMTGSTRTQLLGGFILYYLSNQGLIRPKGTRHALRGQLAGLSEALRRPRWRQTALGAINDCILGGLYEEQILEEDIATEIIPMISTPASTDPDSKSRATLFNLLTQIILKVQPSHAFKFIRDLASEECPYLNMRSSAISLLRRLVVRAFNHDPVRISHFGQVGRLSSLKLAG
ncbi:central kinetochore-associated domain-containing protein [Rhizoctonia solani AG-1 IA]|uniref:Central kinetochore-associated domain-containing protein n=1 Tax=Thanatephorus cucumeris (strain AG1-IA) TaxID=983506 RepID=L8WNQ9_THACA|nr:central kinetochore-associated domain-containing protein [Rhizoctonia solani AG-1 IA]